MDYITSDIHFYHNNMCGPEGFIKGRRQFADAYEMNEYLVKAHNSVVTDKDRVYILGDISMNQNKDDVLEILSRLKGQLVIVKGNHDDESTLRYLEEHNYELPNGKPKFEIHRVGLIKKYNKKIYHLTHYPMLVGSGRGNLRSLHGHIHEAVSPSPNSLNVCIDSPELPLGTKFGVPVRFDEAAAQLEMKYEKYKADWGNDVERKRPHPGQMKFDI